MPKNLLVLTSAYPYGKDYRGTFISEQLKYIKRHYEQIAVVSPLSYFPKFLSHRDFFTAYSGYKDYPINYSVDNIKVFFPRYLPLPLENSCIIKGQGLVNYLVTKNCLKREKLNFRIIHAHFVFPAGYVGAKLKEDYRIPLVLTAHGGDIYNEPFRSENQLQMTKHILDMSDRIITTSQKNRNIICENFEISAERVNIIYNGFDPNIFFIMNKNKVRSKLSLPIYKKIVLSIGNLVEIKGHRYLIQAMKRIISIRKDVLCIIIGNGNNSKLKKQIKDLGLENYITIFSGIQHKDVSLWINACDLFVLPSLNEGSPTIIPEVMACGKPIIATSVGGVPEIIKEKNIGILIKEKTSDEIADMVLLSLERDWNAFRISQYARENYTWEHISHQIIEIYDKLDNKKLSGGTI